MLHELMFAVHERVFMHRELMFITKGKLYHH